MMNIILHSDDINLQTYWKKVFGKDSKLVDDFEELYVIESSLIIINYSAFTTAYKESIKRLKELGNLVFVLHRTPSLKIAKEVLLYGSCGYGNALMKEHFLLSAIDTIKEGMIWLHPEFTSELICQIPQKKEKDISNYISLLSQREKELVFLLKDGNTYKTIAQQLSITPRTVKAHAHSIYTKLNVKDKLALALLLR
ncbi:response regulator transcription factor [Sulfurimonas sp. SAG-AH-194-C20]|nr:LuxR C-terminal-related transcriptional regulator [Sulfurimonas sp. SAG-AH-194-C20]MDF1879385.1 response regulator transcription factor [Sulfurimonas sp. SAG-AH-194-C20]